MAIEYAKCQFDDIPDISSVCSIRISRFLMTCGPNSVGYGAQLHPVGRTAMLLALTGKGMSDELLTFHREGLAKNPELAAAFEHGLEEGGYEGALRATAELQEEWYGKPGKRVTAWTISLNYLRAGDYDMAIDWLEKAYEEHNPNLPYIGWSIYDPLHSDPRFQDLLRKMNLPVDEKE